MLVPAWLWIATVVGLLALIAIDLVIVDRKPHEVTVGEASRWVIFYVAAAVLFGLGLWYFSGSQYAGEFFAGYITEYSLSIDNLFVFVIIMSTFAVPSIHQHKVLLIGILLALIMRGAFIAAGAALIEQFSWIFYIFGGFLLFVAYKQARQGEGNEEEFKEPKLVGFARKVLPVTKDYVGAKSFVKIDGKRWVTPMFIVMLAIGLTDLLFAVDSIPAIFALTKEPYLVFTANAFALMGLRQLYFLIGGLLNRLVYLHIGLAVILGFIGIKLVFEALAGNNLPFLNDGQPISWAPHIGIEISLPFIIGVLIITTVTSLLKTRKDARKDEATAAK
ncbi:MULTISPECIES: TerC family protein [unclassified Crossiella]|uniref:TerC family protein n=1 Tax=unclassified Crossiella TaxID=2620835 RepID=UPI001FFF3B55|nr:MULTISPECIES: TerC family protein [unclassified Crossiella]MCK2239677.1 TerC family protein [Crossiella sp. S99.2]MCK2252372.1 TerC family protein [Crossiella sp. S99.1]